jgi:hypothetical protein
LGSLGTDACDCTNHVRLLEFEVKATLEIFFVL